MGINFRMPRIFSSLSAMFLGGIASGQPAFNFFDFEPIDDPNAYSGGTGRGTKRPSRMQRHSGTKGQGAHRRWKKRRAAGIY